MAAPFTRTLTLSLSLSLSLTLTLTLTLTPAPTLPLPLPPTRSMAAPQRRATAVRSGGGGGGAQGAARSGGRGAAGGRVPWRRPGLAGLVLPRVGSATGGQRGATVGQRAHRGAAQARGGTRATALSLRRQPLRRRSRASAPGR